MAALAVVGVPVKTQAPLRLNPAGSVGQEQAVIGPPTAVGVWVDIAELFVKVNGEPAKANELGATSLTVIVIIAALEPPALIAVIV